MGRTEFDISDVVVRRVLCTPGRLDLGLVSWISPRSENRHDVPPGPIDLGLATSISPKSENRYDDIPSHNHLC